MKALLPQILLLPVLVWLVWSADIWTAVSLMYPAYFFFALISCALLLLPYAIVRRSAVAVIPCLWIAFIVALPFVANSSLKPLIWGVRDLKQGMDRAAVMETLKGSYAGTRFPEPIVKSEEEHTRGPEAQITTRLLIKPQGRASEFQAEGLLVFFEDGRFSHASFSAD